MSKVGTAFKANQPARTWRWRALRDAEVRVREFIRERHPKVRRFLFKRVDRKGDAWLIEGDVWFQRLRLFTVKRNFRLRIGSETERSHPTKRPLLAHARHIAFNCS